MPALRAIAALVIASSASLAASSAFAVDSVALEYGNGNRSDIVRLSAQWNWQKPLWTSNAWELGGHWDANVTRWNEKRYQNIPGNSDNFNSIGFTPVFRLQPKGSKTGFYGEAGLGVHWFSALYNNNGNQLSTHYQFGTLFGTGYRFSNNVDLGLRVQHFSNGGFKSPNSGVNLAIVRAAYRF